MKTFTFVSANNLDEATQLLATHGSDARLIAGGTDLVVQMKAGKINPRFVIDLHRLAELKAIQEDPDGLLIGALMTHAEIARSAVVQQRYTALSEASSQVGGPQVRNRATIGGNICNAVPSADTAPPLLVFDASATVVGPHGVTRSIDLEHFFAGPSRSVLQPGEVLRDLFLPQPPQNSASAYLKLGRRKAMEIALVGVAVRVSVRAGGEFGDVRIALGAVAPTPIRVREAEAFLSGREINPENLQKAAQIAAENARPITDLRASAEYRRDMVAVLTARAFKAALERVCS